MDIIKIKLKNWILKWAHSTHSQVALFAMSFAESSFFPIPPDFLLIGILLTGAKRWWYYALITLIGSLVGGVFGYFIGWAFYSSVGYKIVEIYGLEEVIKNIGLKYEANAILTVFIAAFTPIPYKIITISAGFFKISMFSFIIASLVGRGIRFFAIAIFVKFFGEKISFLIYKYFNIFSIIFGLLIILGFIALKFIF